MLVYLNYPFSLQKNLKLYLYEDGGRGEDERSAPDESQNALGLADGAHGLGFEGVDNCVASENIIKVLINIIKIWMITYIEGLLAG